MISVIIPLYNKEQIIEKCVQSVLSQDYNDFEVVIVNDGSTDRSAEIVKGIGDTRIRFIEQANGGPSKARNTGVKNAAGEWIVFLDADDEFLPGALSHLANLSVQKPLECVFCCPFIQRKNTNKTQPYRYISGKLSNPYGAYFYNLCFPHTGSTMYRRQLIKDNLFDERIRRYEDVEHVFRLFDISGIYLDPEPILMINLDYVSASKGRKSVFEDFVGYLDFHGLSFWKKMCLYKLYLGERILYNDQINKLYPMLKYRYDLFLIYTFLWIITKNDKFFSFFLKISKITNCK